MGGGLATSDNINFGTVMSKPLVSNGGYIQQGNVGNAGSAQSAGSQATGGGFQLSISASPQLGLMNLASLTQSNKAGGSLLSKINGRKITLQKGVIMFTQAPENPSTGYSWIVKSDDDCLGAINVGKKFFAASPMSMGSGGTAEF